MIVFARVVFPLPLAQSFLYAVPEAFRASARPGARVVAPLGTRRQTGFIVGLTTEPPAAGIAIKPLIEVLDDRPFRDDRFLEFTRRLSAEFHSSWGEVLQASLPPSLTLRTKVAVALTDLGREKLAAKGLGPREMAVAALLAEAPKGRSPIYLRRKTGGKDISGLVGRMEKKGLVRVVRTLAAPPRKAGQDPIARAVQLGLAFPEPLRAPGVLAPVYLEGAYSEIYPNKCEDEEGMREFFKEFSFPGGIGSHCTPETPGSIHEGGELGYSVSHAFGAAFDNPDLLVAVMVGDGEAETGPLATSWHSSKFLNPVRDGAVLPILHLNGYKINNPTLLARISHEELDSLFR
ncbi:MAG: hypothetical protein HGA24_12650, partial [Candidatus Aminicenantes bacterium]|nr:hypothetical protein [Candidatus Aminicenantes bacterium]